MRRLYILLFIVMGFAACNKAGEIYENDAPQGASAATTRSAAIEDPYKLSVMQAALDDVAAVTSGMKTVKLSPTDYYIRFQPADTTQMYVLEDLGIDLFYHPLDGTPYESDNTSFKSFEPNGSNWVYSVVPVDFVFPDGISYEIIYEVFIQRESVARSANQLQTDVYDKVLRKALELTGGAITARSGVIGEWEPSASIKLDFGGIIMPLGGLKVSASYGTKIESKFTDNNGKIASFGKFQTSVIFDISWEGRRWQIRSGESKTIYKDGGYICGYTPFEIMFENKNTLSSILAGIHRALNAYFYENHPLTAGLVKPPSISVGVYDESHPNYAGDYNYTGRDNKVHIYAKSRGSELYVNPYYVASTTFHELGHASHYELNGMKPNIKKVKESWATGVEYAYMKSFKFDYSGAKYDAETRKEYTSLVQSLMCQGVKLNDIQNALQSADSWDNWRDNLNGGNILDMLFAYPNRFCFDLKSPIQEVYDKTIFSEQLVWLSLKSEVNMVSSEFKVADVDVLEWILPDNNGRIVYGDKSTVGIIFNPDRSGYAPVGKRIQAKVKYFNGVEEISDYKINVRKDNIISIPESANTYTPWIFKIPIAQFNDPDVYIAEFKVSPDGFVGYFDPEIDRAILVRFDTPGEKTINVKIKYQFNSIEQTVEYNRKITVKTLEDKDSFTLAENTAYPLVPGKRYAAFYGRRAAGKGITIDKIDMRHIKYYFEYNYDKSQWKFDRRNQYIYFEVPDWEPVPVDYLMSIYYRIDGEPSYVRCAEVLLSNN